MSSWELLQMSFGCWQWNVNIIEFIKELHLSRFGRLSNNNQKLLEYSGKAY